LTAQLFLICFCVCSPRWLSLFISEMSQKCSLTLPFFLLIIFHSTGWSKSLCALDDYNTEYYLAQSDCLVADRQGHGDTRLTLTPSVIAYSNYVIMVSDWNCLKYFCVFFCTLIIRCTEAFWSSCSSVCSFVSCVSCYVPSVPSVQVRYANMKGFSYSCTSAALIPRILFCSEGHKKEEDFITSFFEWYAVHMLRRRIQIVEQARTSGVSELYWTVETELIYSLTL
jgi:hypothetical protein